MGGSRDRPSLEPWVPVQTPGLGLTVGLKGSIRCALWILLTTLVDGGDQEYEQEGWGAGGIST